MKKKILLLVGLLMAVVFVCGAQAAEKDSFWDSLRGKLSKITPRKQVETTTSVAGVRGAKNGAESDVYWKGKDKSDIVTQEELDQFNRAVDTKVKGENEQALKQFEEFLTGYPQSPLRVDALQAVEKIKIELGMIKAPEVKAPEEVKAAAKEEAPAKASAKAAKKSSKKKKPAKEAPAK